MPVNATSNGPASLPTPGLSTAALHADHPDHLMDANYALAPSMSLSTTFRSPHPESAHAKLLDDVGKGEAEFDMQDPEFHIYSRYSQSTNIRCEKVLSQIMKANALTYSCGLSAAHAAVLHYAPSVIAIRRGYHGVHVSIQLYCRGRNVKLIDLDDDYAAAVAGASSNSSSSSSSSSDSRAVGTLRHERERAFDSMDQVSLTGDAIAAVVLGWVGTGQGLGVCSVR